MTHHLPDGDPGFSVTTKASSHIQNSLSQAQGGRAVGIRIGVKKAGCSGYEYVLEFLYPEDIAEIDYIFNQEAFKIAIDKEIYLKFLKGGTVLDYRQEGLNEGLKFDNPNVANQCGCGESFTLVSEES